MYRHHLMQMNWANSIGDGMTGRTVSCCPWDCKELDTAVDKSNSNNNYVYVYVSLIYVFGVI